MMQKLWKHNKNRLFQVYISAPNDPYFCLFINTFFYNSPLSLAVLLDDGFGEISFCCVDFLPFLS